MKLFSYALAAFALITSAHFAFAGEFGIPDSRNRAAGFSTAGTGLSKSGKTVSLSVPVAVSSGGTGATSAGVTAAGNIGALAVSNNLSDLNSTSTSRTNLGLGTAATQNTGTSGGNIPLLNGANTWSGVQTMTNSDLAVLGSSTGATTITSDNSSATNYTVHLPAANDTMTLNAATQTLTNKSIAGSEINSGNIPFAQTPAIVQAMTSANVMSNFGGL